MDACSFVYLDHFLELSVSAYYVRKTGKALVHMFIILPFFDCWGIVTKKTKQNRLSDVPDHIW